MLKIKAHFNKQTKDSKKELVQFYVKGEDENLPELNALVREVVELSIGDLEPLTAEFVKKSQDAKKTVLDFVINGGASNKHSFEFYRLAGTDVELSIGESEVDIDEFREQQEAYREGLKVKVNPDGTVDVDKDQMSFDDLESESGESEGAGEADPMAGVGENDETDEDELE